MDLENFRTPNGLRQTRVYVAGPIKKGDRAENLRRGIEAGERLHAAGYVVFIPHLNELWQAQHPHTWTEWLEHDLEWVSQCDAVLRIDGESEGADLEVTFAEVRGIPVFRTHEDLVAKLPISQRTGLGRWQHRAFAAASARGFHSKPTTVEDLGKYLMNLHSEVTEAWEEYRTGHAPAEVYEKNGKPEGIPTELADIFIRVMDTAEAFGIDLEREVERKMAYNATRPHRHGGKLA